MKLFKKSFTIFFLLATCCASLTWAQPSGSFSCVRLKHELIFKSEHKHTFGFFKLQHESPRLSHPIEKANYARSHGRPINPFQNSSLSDLSVTKAAKKKTAQRRSRWQLKV